jgi:hypothetical protein
VTRRDRQLAEAKRKRVAPDRERALP